jgi:hypothetical protein
MPVYHDFTLTVTGEPGNYSVSARAPGSINVSAETFNYQPSPELAYELERVRNGDSPTRERMQEIGSLLFNALFTRRISNAFGHSYQAISKEESLRLLLALQPPELAALPWELLFNPDEGVFMAARLSYPIAREVDSGIPVAEPVLTKKIKILYIQASPVDLPPLELMKSENALRGALGDKAEVTAVRAARPDQLQRLLRQDFHILHYDGHAFFSEESQSGAICLEDEEKYPSSKWRNPGSLSRWFQHSPGCPFCLPVCYGFPRETLLRHRPGIIENQQPPRCGCHAVFCS